MERLTDVKLNGIGMTQIESINNLTEKLKTKYNDTYLKNLDISSNQIKDINGIENIKSLVSFVVSNNPLESVPDLSKLENLETLSMNSDTLSEIPKVNGLKKLKTAYYSNNNIYDISRLKELSGDCLKDLNLSNNSLNDDSVKDLENFNLAKLDISGNKITDISPLNRYMNNYDSLIVSNNKIADVSPIENNFRRNNEYEAYNQKLEYPIEENSQETITVDLPQIFIASKRNNGLFYTDKDFILQNCTISGNTVSVNTVELGNTVASVKIDGGQAKGTELIIARPIEATITYNPEYEEGKLINQDVTATITFAKSGISVTNNGNENANQYTFTKNGDFTFEFVDQDGKTGSKTARVTWIDKEAPRIVLKEGESNKLAYYNPTSLTPKITDANLESVVLNKNGKPVEDYNEEYRISELGKYEIIATDKAGNVTKVTFSIRDRVPSENEKIISDVYEIDQDKREIKIKNESEKDLTNVSILNDNIICDMNYEIKNRDGQTVNNDTIGTGYKIEVEDGTIYNIIVMGDCNGDGKCDLTDMMRINNHRLYEKPIDTLNDLGMKAGDVNNDGRCDLNDMMRINNHRLYDKPLVY